jgi:glycosyltransferase involved in cell wall biosynthesis
MNIGFDAKRLFYNKTGLGNYSRNIVNYLQKYYNNNKYYLFSPNIKKPLTFDLQSCTLKVNATKTFLNLHSFWRSKGILNEKDFHKLDVYHGLSSELPIGISKTNVKSVVTIHDLIYVHYPQFYNFFDRKIYLHKLKLACAAANKIIAISRQTKNDLIEILDIKPEKIEIVYQGCNDIFKNKVTETTKQIIKEKYKLPNEFILNVGTIEKRKNILQVIKALKISNIDFPLVIIGKATDYSKEVKKYVVDNKMENQIFFLHNADFEDFPAIYQSAKIFIYPSIIEGFGIPLIEAFYSQIPIITSDIDVFREVAENSAIFIKPQNIEDISEKILFLLNNSDLRNIMITKGQNRLQFFDDKKIASDIIKIYNNL